MKTKLLAWVLPLLVVLAGATAYRWVQDAPRRQSLTSLSRLDAALHSADATELLGLVVLPAAVQQRTATEQSDFLAKALHNEISPGGLAVLRKQADYGPLMKLFPAEAEGWASQASVNVADCVAFRMERHGFRAEVVLVRASSLNARRSRAEPSYRVVRLNNVMQMDDANF